ncbi:MAG: TIGR03984 family CRISPR-associated protein [Acidobacteriia bacterium]|nr:TIGR03984 family CRISPR-associated protein [Terriglobia bacterium]
MKPREIKSHPALVEPVGIKGMGNVNDWLQTQAAQHKLKWLLAHADDGLIWGRMDDGKLGTSHEAGRGNPEAEKACPELRIQTLQQARLFSETAELLLWRDGDNQWHARLIRDTDTQQGEQSNWDVAIDEAQILWGTDPTPLADGFTMMSDGEQGLRHAVPLKIEKHFNEETRPLRLHVRHYLSKGGFALIEASRLFKLDMEVNQ